MFMDLNLVDGGELLRRAVKYLVEGLMVAIAAYAIPKKSLHMEEVLLIALSAAATASSIPTSRVWRSLPALVPDLVWART